jgi:hypothetical protein
MAKSQPKKQRSKKEIVNQIKQDAVVSNHSSAETVSIGWCDNGMVEGRFATAIMAILTEGPKVGINVVNHLRVNGNQIARQRQALFDAWAGMGTDWLLWVDSDIIPTTQVVKMIWDAADKANKPVVSGTYFVSNENEQTLMEPIPALYKETGDEFLTQPIHPLPQNQLIPVDISGFGLILMHKSIIEKVREQAEGYSVFGEKQNPGSKFVSEDVAFCRYLKKAGIQMYAHTGALVQHMKTFSFDFNYYYVYWKGIQDKIINRKPRVAPTDSKTK